MVYEENPMTKARLIKLLENVPDNAFINVMNENGELTANIEFWFENLDSRKSVELRGLTPFWKLRDEERKRIKSQVSK